MSTNSVTWISNVIHTHTHIHIHICTHVRILLPQNVAIDRRFLVDKTLVYRLKRIDDSTSNVPKFRRFRWKANRLQPFAHFDPIDTARNRREIYLNLVENSDIKFTSIVKNIPCRQEEEKRKKKKTRTIHRTSSLFLSLSLSTVLSKSLSQSLYRFPRIKLVLIVSESLLFSSPRASSKRGNKTSHFLLRATDAESAKKISLSSPLPFSLLFLTIFSWRWNSTLPPTRSDLIFVERMEWANTRSR